MLGLAACTTGAADAPWHRRTDGAAPTMSEISERHVQASRFVAEIRLHDSYMKGKRYVRGPAG